MKSPTRNQKRYECRWHDAGASTESTPKHYWVDHQPNEPHWPESAVMRWDLRQKDWDRIWPELVDHPCAILFAPRHPNRVGPPRFRDWVESWPAGFDWKAQLPDHLHSAIHKALSEVAVAVRSETLEPGSQDQTPSPALPEQSVEPEDILEQLSVILLDVNDNKRELIAQHLSTLAMAPDSGRVIQALKLAFKK